MDIALAHSNSAVLHGLAMLVSEKEELNVVSMCESLDDLAEKAREMNHDLIVVDAGIARGTYSEVAAVADTGEEPVPIAIVSGEASLAEAHRALRAGIRSYLSLDSAPEILRLQLRLAADGNGVICSEAAAGLSEVVALLPEEFGQGGSESKPDTLTERELEVLELLAAGYTNPEIADELTITENTVKAHVSSILSKLDVKNRQQATGLALQTNLVREVEFVTEVREGARSGR